MSRITRARGWYGSRLILVARAGARNPFEVATRATASSSARRGADPLEVTLRARARRLRAPAGNTGRYGAGKTAVARTLLRGPRTSTTRPEETSMSAPVTW